MKEEHEQPGREAKEHAESKSNKERELEEKWSQGGQDVEEEQHDKPAVDA